MSCDKFLLLKRNLVKSNVAIERINVDISVHVSLITKLYTYLYGDKAKGINSI